MKATAPKALLAFQKQFSELRDPRINRTKKHSLESVLAIAFSSILMGANGWDALEDFGRHHESFFATFLDLPHGTPSADTFRRFFCAVDLTAFELLFRAWARSLGRELSGTVVATDGKAVRGAVVKGRLKFPLHLMHVWSVEHQLVLAQKRVNGASGEPAALLEMLQQLDLEGATVTADAGNCTKPVTEHIRGAKAHYALALKGNRGPIFAAAKACFALEEALNFTGCSVMLSDEEGHGRLETRVTYALTVTPEMKLPLVSKKSTHSWHDVKSLVMIERSRTVKKKTTIERHYFLSSHEADASKLAKVIRSHWSVENGLHWMLDVGFDEDRRHIRDQKGAECFALMNRMALAMLKRADLGKRHTSIASKRKLLDWQPDLVPSVIAAGFQAI